MQCGSKIAALATETADSRMDKKFVSGISPKSQWASENAPICSCWAIPLLKPSTLGVTRTVVYTYSQYTYSAAARYLNHTDSEGVEIVQGHSRASGRGGDWPTSQVPLALGHRDGVGYYHATSWQWAARARKFKFLPHTFACCIFFSSGAWRTLRVRSDPAASSCD